MAKERILITGTDGFVGSHLKEHFLKEGYEVYGTTYYRDPEDEREVRMDFSKDEEFSKLWTDKEFPTVIHTVGIVDTVGSIPDEVFDAVHTGGTKRITEYSKKQGCKHFIFTSSIATYGMGGMKENITEENTERQLEKNTSAYGRTKVEAEIVIEDSGLEYSNIRLPIVQGKKDTFISQSIIPMLEAQKPFHCSKEEKQVSLMYIKNLGPMVSRLLETGPLNASLNCLSHNVGWEELVTEYAKNLNIDYNPKKKNFMWIYLTRNRRRPGDTLVAAYSAMGSQMTGEALFEKLGDWKPPYSWKDGIKEATDEYLISSEK
ncbi:MAG: NAD-dependent epimerase/dehydratase family protein [Candidatus Heimdallarchaeaceae archaeon]|jgi:nucleoside-diphosphate-sugar epimerase